MKPSSHIPTVQLDEGACLYGAGVLTKHLQALEEETQGIREGQQDIEFVHRARVASRRLRASMPLFIDCLPRKKSKIWLKQIRRVTGALGEARDTDVQLERLVEFLKAQTDPAVKRGVLRIILRLRQKRARLQGSITKAMNRLQENGLVEEMLAKLRPIAERGNEVYMYTPSLYQHSFSSIDRRLVGLLAYDEIVAQPDKLTELHQMRIAAKWLRYTMENFAPLYSSQLKEHLQIVKKIQDLLGEIHDCDVWLEFLPVFLAQERKRIINFYGNARTFPRLEPGIQAFQRDRQDARAAMYSEFVNLWQGWKADDTWPSLVRNVQVPFLQPGSIYPPRAPLPEGQDMNSGTPG